MADGSRALHFKQIHSSSLVKEGHHITFVGADGLGYSAIIDHALVAPLVDRLQNRDAIRRDGPGADVLTLTLLGTQSLFAPGRKGIALRTQEWGTIAVAVSDEMISHLRKVLDELEAPPPRDTRN